jgi:DNA-binding transcriptional ArsR family regulator
MSRSQNNELRNAMKNLRVDLPMKLKGGPNFQPPTPPGANAKEAPLVEVPPPQAPRNEEPRNQVPHCEVAHLKHTQIELTESEHAQNEPPQNRTLPESHQEAETPCPSAPERKAQTEVLQCEVPRLEAPQKKPPENKATKNEVPHHEVARKEVSRNEVPQFEEPQNQQTQVEQAESMPTGGFFKLSHNVFQEPLLRKLSGDCFRLFLWLSARGWRFPTSGGEVRASVRFMEDHTGMGHATISRSLKTLKEAGLLTLLETDFKRGNLWRVSSLACGGHRGPEDLPPRSEVPRNERAQKDNVATSKRESSSLKMREEAPQTECNIRSIKKEKNNSEKAEKIGEENSDSMRIALLHFDSEVETGLREKIISDYAERNSTKSFRVPPGVARMLAASDWYRTRENSSQSSYGRQGH